MRVRWWCGTFAIRSAWSKSLSTLTRSISRSAAPTNISTAVRDRRHSSPSRRPIRPQRRIRCRAGGGMPPPLPSIVTSGPMHGIKRFLCGTQPIISLRGVDVALDAMEGVEVAALRQKSLALTELFMARVAALLPDLEIVTPRRAIVARQPGRDLLRQGLCRGPGDDRARRDRRFPRARPDALWLRAALCPISGCLGCRGDTRRAASTRRSGAIPALTGSLT